jgi:hypothetical protein
VGFGESSVFGGSVLGLEGKEQVVVGFSEISVGAGEDTGGFHSRRMALV